MFDAETICGLSLEPVGPQGVMDLGPITRLRRLGGGFKADALGSHSDWRQDKAESA